MEKQEEIKSFSEVYPPQPQFEAEQVKFADILGKEIVVKDIAELSGGYGEFLIVLADLDGKEVQFPTGSTVVKPKLIKAKKENSLPLRLKIVEKTSEKSKMEYYDIE